MESVGCCRRVVIWQWWRIVGLGMVCDEVFVGLGRALMGKVWWCRDGFVMGSGWCDFSEWNFVMVFDGVVMTFDGKFSDQRNFLSKPIKNHQKRWQNFMVSRNIGIWSEIMRFLSWGFDDLLMTFDQKISVAAWVCDGLLIMDCPLWIVCGGLVIKDVLSRPARRHPVCQTGPWSRRLYVFLDQGCCNDAPEKT